jgi:hypothetical protein
MKVSDFLTAPSPSAVLEEPFLIGETGFSFVRRRRPALPLAEWTQGEIPKTARDVLQVQSAFTHFVGLVRVAIELDELGATRAEWILGRTSTGLLSVVVRDASQCTTKQLSEDVTFAVAEGERYCAAAAVVFVQQLRDAADECSGTLQSTFGVASAEVDVLYMSNLITDLPVWFAILSPHQP